MLERGLCLCVRMTQKLQRNLPCSVSEQEAAVDAPPMTVMLAVKQACQTDDVPRCGSLTCTCDRRTIGFGLSHGPADQSPPLPTPSAPQIPVALPAVLVVLRASIGRTESIDPFGAVRSFDRNGCAGNDDVSLLVSPIPERRAGGGSVRAFADAVALPAKMRAYRSASR